MNTRGETTAYFNSRDEAEAAMSRLQQLGVPDSDMSLHHSSGSTGSRSDERSFIERVKDFFTGEEHTTNESSFDEGALLTVYSDDPSTIATLRESNGYIQTGKDDENRSESAMRTPMTRGEVSADEYEVVTDEVRVGTVGDMGDNKSR